MNEPETLTLTWEGPVLPTAMDLGVDAMERLSRPGVYLCMQRYPAAERVRVYAGVTKDFRLRLREHVAATLGLTYDIADETGRVQFRHTHRDSLFEAAADVDRLHRLAADEVKRMTWFHALDDSDPYIPWHMAEGMLIQRIKGLAATGAMTGEGDIVDAVNERGGAMPAVPVVLRNRGAEAAVDLLGAEIAWPLEDAA